MSVRVSIHYGRKGSGKSYTAKRLAEKRHGRAGVVVWDPNAEWAGRNGRDVPKRKRLAVRSMPLFLEAQARERKLLAPCLVFQLELSAFDRWASWVLRCGNLLAIIDEAQLVAGAQHLPPGMTRLATTCRHRNVDLLLCCQRPTTIHPTIRAQADTVRAWKMTEPRDLAYMREACSSPFSRELPKLAARKFSEWNA